MSIPHMPWFPRVLWWMRWGTTERADVPQMACHNDCRFLISSRLQNSHYLRAFFRCGVF